MNNINETLILSNLLMKLMAILYHYYDTVEQTVLWRKKLICKIIVVVVVVVYLEILPQQGAAKFTLFTL